MHIKIGVGTRRDYFFASPALDVLQIRKNMLLMPMYIYRDLGYPLQG
jgi:hypothetical protein